MKPEDKVQATSLECYMGAGLQSVTRGMAPGEKMELTNTDVITHIERSFTAWSELIVH